MYLVDTNILLRVVHRNDPRHTLVRGAARALHIDGHTLHATPQNCTEFWHASTRPTHRNGFGLTPTATERLLRIVERLFPLLPDSPAIYSEWRRLVVEYGVSGVQAYDARLAAAMLVHHVTYVLTGNVPDFARYAPEGIVAVDPTTV